MNMTNYLWFLTEKQIEQSLTNFSFSFLFTVTRVWGCVYVYALSSQFLSSLFNHLFVTGSLIYIGFNQLIHSILIGWLPLGRIASLYKSWVFISLLWTVVMHCVCCQNRLTVFCYYFDCSAIQLTSHSQLLVYFNWQVGPRLLTTI
jgi:hypothetical protein